VAAPSLYLAMPTRGHALSTIGAAALLVLFAAIWSLLAPIPFGGQAAYVIVSGQSMEPLFRRGDLVILRQSESYEVGDVVTYRHPSIGPIIHRIIGRADAGYVFQGDNNAWVDEYHPAQDELIGKLWLHVPRAGTLVERLRSPAGMAVLVAVMGGVVMSSGAESVRRGAYQRRGRTLLTVRFVVGRRAPERQERGRADRRRAGGGEDVLFAVAVLALAAGLLALVAFTRPAARSSSADIGYEQRAALSYTAAAPPGVYDGGAARSGDPVFLGLSDRLEVRLDYRLASEQPSELRGAYRLDAEVADADGWRRTIELAAATPFAGGAFTASAALDLAQALALVEAFEEQTGRPRAQYTLSIVPRVTIEGTLAGQPLNDDFAPRLAFQFDKQELRVLKDPDGRDPFNPTKLGMLSRMSSVPNTLSIFGLKLDVLAARRAGLAGLALAVSAGLFFGWRAGRARGSEEVGRIQRRYGALLIELRGEAPEAAGQTVEVARFDDLAKIAERGGHMVLHQVAGGTHRYLVWDGSVAYRYSLIETRTNQPAVPRS
jgi:signal peptidase I